MKAEIEEVVIDTDERFAELFKQSLNDIKACCRAKEVKIRKIEK
jgi:valyl-tRNA synthetase